MSALTVAPVLVIAPDCKPWPWERQPDPMGPFIRGKDAPYIFRLPKTDGSLVAPVRCKTDLVTTRSGVVHRSTAVASVLEGGRVRLGARWACGGTSSNVILIASPEQSAVCLICEDKIDPQPCVYRCIDADGTLLYIGSTFQHRQRFRAHERNSTWWPRVADIKLQPFPNILEARLAEARAIYSENPSCNRQGRSA